MAKKRRRHSIRGLNKASITGVATSAVIGGVGAVVINKLLRAFLPADYQQYTNYATAAAGITVAAMSSNSYLQAAGMGAATVAAAQVVGDLADGQGGVNLLPPGVPSVRIAGGDDVVQL